MNEALPEFTFLWLNYNEGFQIYYTFNELIKSDLSNSEIIIIDDNSVDDSEVILNELKNSYENFRLIKNDVHMGYKNSVIKGIDNSKGKYIISFTPGDFLTHDDFNILKEHSKDRDFIIGLNPIEFIYEKYIDILKRKIKSIKLFLNYGLKYSDLHSTVFVIRKDIFNKIKRDLHSEYISYDIINILLKSNYKVGQIILSSEKGVIIG